MTSTDFDTEKWERAYTRQFRRKNRIWRFAVRAYLRAAWWMPAWYKWIVLFNLRFYNSDTRWYP